MYWFVILVISILFISQLINNRARLYTNIHDCISKDGIAKILYFLMILVLVLFSGLRTGYTDTPVYMDIFVYEVRPLDSNFLFKLFSSYGGWEFFNSAIKTFIGDNPHTIIVLSSLFYVVLSLSFIRRFSYDFTMTVFMFTISSYVLEMNGIKQMLAISIALFSIYGILNKKIISSIILMLISMSFHPYVIIMYIAIILKDKVLDRKTVLFSLVIILFYLFGMDIVYSLFSVVGKDYSDLYTLNTINIGRVIFEFIPIVLIIMNRRKINALNDKVLNVMCNLQVVSYMFLLIAIGFNPVMSGRMQMYFSMFSFILIPKLLSLTFPKDILGRFMMYGLFFVYCILDLTKLGAYSFFLNRFHQTSIFNAFADINLFAYFIFVILIVGLSFCIQNVVFKDKRKQVLGGKGVNAGHE